MTRRQQKKSLTESLREAIAESGLSFAELERRTGVLRQTLMKFARDEQTIYLEAADKLADCFGLELKPREDK